MHLTATQIQEFRPLAQPLIRWMDENCHPHCHVVLNNRHAEISEGFMVECLTGPACDEPLCPEPIMRIEQDKDAIVRELVAAMRHLGARSDLLGIVCSYGETLDDRAVLALLAEWNSHGPVGADGGVVPNSGKVS